MVNLKKINKEEFGKLVMPEKIFKLKIKSELENLIEKVHFDNLNYLIITNIFIISLIISFSTYLIFFEKIFEIFNFITFGLIFKSLSEILENFSLKIIYIFITFFINSILTYYFILFIYFFNINSKYKITQDKIEKDLPEFIDGLVSNIKGGISLEKSLLKSVRKGQKELLHEVTLINEKILMGKTTIEALREFKNRYDSEILSRTIFLIEEGIKGGGNIAKPLERISENLKKVYMLNEEIKGSAGGFAIIIQSISILIAPLLFALAITLLTFIGDLMGLLSETNVSILSTGEIPPEFKTYLVTFSFAMIGLITLFSSLITSALKNEKSYEAIKYLPIYIILSIFLYKIFSSILLGFFGGIIG